MPDRTDRIAARIPNVALTTQAGTRVRFHDDLVRGHVVVMNMMYALCNATCPPATRNLVEVQRLLGPRVGREILMLSLSLRPAEDTPDALAAYARLHGVGPGWLFLTGEPRDAQAVRTALGFFDPDPAVDRDLGRHTGMVRIGNEAFDRWGMAPALAAPRQIVNAIRHVERRTV